MGRSGLKLQMRYSVAKLVMLENIVQYVKGLKD